MATIKTYIVKRAGWAQKKGGGDVHITRQNQDQIPVLLSKAAIKERVDSGAFEEVDTGVEETEVEMAEQLEAEADLRSKKKRS